ncbi:hypothetical protein HDE_08787 [Halotydeus destructor]|nr:hypothetical protein HDE_08787 [Halotydeus destructor]
MANELNTGKSVVILAVVIGCFAVLWPQIFYPMLSSFFATNHRNDIDRNINIHPSMMHPRLREAMKSAPLIVAKKETTRSPSPLLSQVSGQQATDKQPINQGGNGNGQKLAGGGAMSFIMPVYTIAIVIFFVFTIFKLLTRKEDEELNSVKPVLKDFAMDPENRKYILSEQYDEAGSTIMANLDTRRRQLIVEKCPRDMWPGHATISAKLHNQSTRGGRKSNAVNRQLNDPELFKLRKNLRDKEAALALLLKKMNSTSSSLVDTGILPSIPGLFCGRGDFGFDKKTLSNSTVSTALRTLIVDMETFKTYLIQVEDGRNRLDKYKSNQVNYDDEVSSTTTDDSELQEASVLNEVSRNTEDSGPNHAERLDIVSAIGIEVSSDQVESNSIQSRQDQEDNNGGQCLAETANDQLSADCEPIMAEE